MDEASALIAVAEIAVAIAGFSGVAMALGPRSDAEFWSPSQRARFIDLITHSGIGLFASLLPLIMLHGFGEGTEIWTESSLIWAFCGCIGIASGILRRRKLPPVVGIERWIPLIVQTCFAALVLLQVYNALTAGAFWPYLAALVGNLGFAFVQFMRMVVPRAPTGEVAD